MFDDLQRDAYGAIVADPPWHYRVWSAKGTGRSAEQHYPVMETEDIAALPVASLALPDCALFLWATSPCIQAAFRVIEAWGFEYKTFAFTWVKRNRKSSGLFWGLGHWTRANPEFCLLATRGKPKRKAANVHSVIESPVMEHSRKPDESYVRVGRLVNGPYCELFARRRRGGWDAWGYGVDEGAPVVEASKPVYRRRLF